MAILDNVEAVVLDMDGVIFIGRRLRQGIERLLEHLEGAGIRYHVLTNTSGTSGRDISIQLASMGLAIPRGKIINASEVTADYMRSRSLGGRVFTLGGGLALPDALRAAGFQPLVVEHLTEGEIVALLDAEPPVAYPLALGWTRDYGFELATRLLRLEDCISELYTASADRFFADEGGKLPAVAWLASSVGALLGKSAFNPAKPNAFALEYVLRKLDSTAAKTAVIGDSISDVQFGNAAGCKTILVLGGATAAATVDNLEGDSVPTHVIHELTELL
jgi:HAD superfamily hydrolase (TIGR01450 family)